MATVTEVVDAFPLDDSFTRIKRNEDLLFAKPGPPVSRFLQEYPLLEAYHLPTEFIPAQFSPPKDVFKNEHVRVEWQQMNQRQPFYHRNADVDEISFHVSGERTLITDRGSVDLKFGDYARIPVFTAHDNRGVNDVHLIFYFHPPALEQVKATRETEFKIPPFEGWKAQHIPEVITECLGSLGCDRAVSLVDEDMLLRAASDSNVNSIKVLNIFDPKNTGSAEELWFYKSDIIWLGSTTLSKTTGDGYRRHRCAEELQYQVQGKRTLITQRGIIALEPGDFVCIPLGTAFTNVVDETSVHLSLLTRLPLECKAEGGRKATEASGGSKRAKLINGSAA